MLAISIVFYSYSTMAYYKPTFFSGQPPPKMPCPPCQGVEEGVSYAMCVKYLPGNKPGDPRSQSEVTSLW